MSAAPENPVVVIPARMASRRLPGKPLADILGTPMITHVWRRAMEADVGPVLVAVAEAEIADAIGAAGGQVIQTRPDHATGSDRVFEALESWGGKYDAVINLQGDLPMIAPAAIRAVLGPLDDGSVDIATLAAPIAEAAERDDESVVKAVISVPAGGQRGRALYFSRVPVPSGAGPIFHHIGIYAYRPAALARFVTLPRGVLERRERLEQLRALEAGMRIDAALVDTYPLGVDTPADLERARALLAQV